MPSTTPTSAPPTGPQALLAHWGSWLAALPVVALAMWLMSPVLRGGVPTSSDHMAHMFQSWDLWTHRLPWRIGGWSDLWFFGYPAGELYHPGADLWVAGWRALTLGLLDHADGYALAFVAFFVFSGLALYRYGARELGWLAGMLGTCLWLLDRGEYEQGGWLYLVRAGVWPQALGLAFFFAGLTWLERGIDSLRPRALAVAGLLMGCAILAHPLDLVLLGLCLPLPWLARWITRRPRGRTALLAPTVVLLLGAGLAGFYWIPLAARTGWTEAVGYPWLTAAEIAGGLLQGELFANLPPWVTWLGLLGGVLAVLRRRPGGVLLLLLFLLLMAGAAAELSQGLAELTGSDALARFQYRRFSIPAKACLFLMAGYPVQSLVDLVWRSAGSDRLASGTVPLARGGVALVLAVLSVGLLAWQGPALRAHVATLDLPTAGAGGQWAELQQLNAWVREQDAEQPGFWRIAYEGNEHDQFFWAAPVYNGRPGYKPGFTCCRIFGLIPEGREPALYRALGVRYVVSQGPADAPDRTLLQQFGVLHAYAFDGFEPQRYTLLGPGAVEVERFEGEHIRLHITDTTPDTRLRLHVAHFPRWQARVNGQSVPIDVGPPATGQRPILMELPVSDGTVELRYRRQLIDWLSMLASLLAAAACGWLLWRNRWPRWGSRG
jgi:hypothetical protein